MCILGWEIFYRIRFMPVEHPGGYIMLELSVCFQYIPFLGTLNHVLETITFGILISLFQII
jgi:hypothetical protein